MANPIDPNKYPIGMSKVPILPTPTGNPITAPSTVKAPTVKPLAQMTVAEAQASGQGDAYNKLVSGYSTPNISTTNINPNLIKPTTGTYNPPAPTSPLASAVTSGIGTTANKIETAQKTEPTPTDVTTKTGVQSYLAQLLGKQENSAQDAQTLRETAQIAEKEATARKLGTDITARKRAYEDQIKQLEKNPEGKLRGALEAEVGDLRRKANSELADMAIQYEVANGDYQAAEKLVNQQIEDINTSYDRRIKTAQIAYDFLQNDLTESEKIQAQANVSKLADERNFEQQKALANYNSQLNKNEMTYKAGLDTQTLQSTGTITTDTGKPLNDTQATAYGYANRLVEAGNIINSIGGNFTGASSYVGQNLPNIAKSAERQSYEQAQRNFVNAVLRKESGAVISPQEFASAQRQYFPQPGDSEKVVQQKTANRNTVINNLYRSAGVSGQKSQEVVTRPEDLRAKYAY